MSDTKSKNVLLYYPPNKNSVAIETLCKAVAEAGHDLTALTLTEWGPFHEALAKMGIHANTRVLPRRPSWRYFPRQVWFLVWFCRQHKIDVVWSHLQEANLIAVLAQRFLRARVVVFRHHAESAFYAEYGKQFGMRRNSNEVWFDRTINRLASTIVVPSSGVWRSMERYEGCDMTKVVMAPYIYDFASYAAPRRENAQAIREAYPCRLRLIMVSRMVPAKQHMPVFEILNKLISEGLSVKMIVMDDGPLRPVLERYIADEGLGEHISLVGFRNDFMDFMAASDLLVHPSLTEASSNVVKELALLEKAAAVCRDVGDFNDYIEDGRNGFFIERHSLKASIEHVIRKAYAEQAVLTAMGREARIDVMRMFGDSAENRARFVALL